MKNLKILLICLVISLITVSETFARQYFDKSKDFLLANYDLKPDEDDVMAATAFACMLKHSDLSGVNFMAVAGAYGKQGGSYIHTATPGLYNTLFGAQNQKWTDAHNDRNGSLNRVRDKIRNTLNSGGKVFVAEAGQSDFTYDVLQRVINSGVSASVVKSRVIVVQHSNWNENQTTTSKLNWVKSNTDYTKLDDGNNGGNNTPKYKSDDTKWLNNAKSSSNATARNFWTQADNLLNAWNPSWKNPTIEAGGVDYSDAVEIWWIFNLGSTANDVSKFWSRYITNGSTTPPGGNDDITGVNGPTSIAQGANGTITINYSASTSRDIYVNLISKTTWKTAVNAKKTVNAGNGSTTITLTVPSGTATGNYVWKAWMTTVNGNWGARFDEMSQNVSVTSGSTTPPPGGDAPIGSWIWMKAYNGKYVCADKSIANTPFIANRSGLGSWEKFQVVDAGGGYIALKANSNGKYASVRNNVSGAPLRAEAGSIGDWEKLTWSKVSSNKVAFKAKVNGKYIWSQNNETNAPLYAKGPSIKGWETFTWGATTKSAGADDTATELAVYPNPVKDELTLTYGTELQTEATLMIYNSNGRLVHSEPFNSNRLQISTSELVGGMYMLRLINGNDIITKRIIKQ